MLNDPLERLHIAEEDQFVPKEAQALIIASLKNHPQVQIHTYPGRDLRLSPGEAESTMTPPTRRLPRERTLALFRKALV